MAGKSLQERCRSNRCSRVGSMISLTYRSHSRNTARGSSRRSPCESLKPDSFSGDRGRPVLGPTRLTVSARPSDSMRNKLTDRSASGGAATGVFSLGSSGRDRRFVRASAKAKPGRNPFRSMGARIFSGFDRLTADCVVFGVLNPRRQSDARAVRCANRHDEKPLDE
jgi:hypothetical protein